jgi:hypothetical protein
LQRQQLPLVDREGVALSAGRSERLSDLRESFVEVLAISGIQNRFTAGLDPDGAVAVEFDFFCGDERYVALTVIGDLAKRNFAERHHIIVPPVCSLYWHWSSLHLRPDKLSLRGCNFTA